MLKLPVGILSLTSVATFHNCISGDFIQRPKPGKQAGYSRSMFNSELSDAFASQTNFSDQFDVDTASSYFTIHYCHLLTNIPL